MLTFPRSRVLEFYKQLPLLSSHLRLGQAFYNFMELDKVTEPESKALCDSLYQVNSGIATKIIIDNTDWEN